MYSIIPKTPERGNEVSWQLRRKLVVYLILSIRLSNIGVDKKFPNKIKKTFFLRKISYYLQMYF